MSNKTSLSHTIQSLPASTFENVLAGKVILITGAGSGIGKSASFALAKAGATVVLVGRELHKLEEVYDQIEDDGGAQPAIFPMNLESVTDEDCQALLNALNEEFEALDGIIHCAAIIGPRTPLAQCKTHLWQQVMQVNVHSPFMISKTLLPALSKSKNGKLIFMGDDMGDSGGAFSGAYSASKAALNRLAEVFADELEDTSRIQSICFYPGPCRTPLRATAYPAEDPTTIKPTSDLDHAITYLMSDLSSDFKGTKIYY